MGFNSLDPQNIWTGEKYSFFNGNFSIVEENSKLRMNMNVLEPDLFCYTTDLNPHQIVMDSKHWV